MREKKLSQREIENKLAEFKLYGWTSDINLFTEFVQIATYTMPQIGRDYNSFFISLSTAAKEIFDKNIEPIKSAHSTSSNKRDYLKLQLKDYYIDPEELANNRNKRRNNNHLIELGYSFGLKQIDFCIYDFIHSVHNRPSLSFLGIEYYSTSQIHNEIFPTTIENFYSSFSPYLRNFKEIVNGYSQFLTANEILKMLKSLDNLNEIENLKESGIEKENTQKKLKWEGQKNQLYDVIRQLKKKELIANSYMEIATFICQNLEGFETNFPTVLKEIQKDERPAKNKRIDLDLSELIENDTE